MAKTTYGTFEDILKITEEHLQPVAIQLRQVILEIHPKTCEVVRSGEKTSSYGVGPKKMSEAYAYIMPHKEWVNLGFYKGAMLDDQNNLLEGTGKKLRHIKIHNIQDAKKPEIGDLLKLALKERQLTLDSN